MSIGNCSTMIPSSESTTMATLVDNLNTSEIWLPQVERERREALRRPKIIRMVGVDLGQAGDYTAITAAEFHPDIAYIRGLERLPLGTPYTARDRSSVVSRVADIMALPQLKDAYLLIDRTGVGRAVYDLFVEKGLKPIGITITGGNLVHPVMGGFSVPKRDLVFSLVALFQAGAIKIPGLSPEADTLVKELMNFKMKIKADTAHDSYEAWREGDHDDLVLSASLPCWFMNYRFNTKKPRKAAQQHQRW
jgi:hypothetical protein